MQLCNVQAAGALGKVLPPHRAGPGHHGQAGQREQGRAGWRAHQVYGV